MARGARHVAGPSYVHNANRGATGIAGYTSPMQVAEMRAHLEAIARDETVAASARVRALEVLLRVERSHPATDDEWNESVQRFGVPDVE